MACSCNKKHATRPTETCIFCAHKHLVSAGELYRRGEFSMTAGQLNCASKHYNSDFRDMRDRADSLIMDLYKGGEIGEALELLRTDAWQMVLDNQENKTVYPLSRAILPKPAAPDLCMAHLSVATARALYDLEIGYKDINKSEAMGELILAAWHLQRDHIGLAWKCKYLWGRIEKLQDCSTALEALEQELWQMVTEKQEAMQDQCVANQKTSE